MRLITRDPTPLICDRCPRGGIKDVCEQGGSRLDGVIQYMGENIDKLLNPLQTASGPHWLYDSAHMVISYRRFGWGRDP